MEVNFKVVWKVGSNDLESDGGLEVGRISLWGLDCNNYD